MASFWDSFESAIHGNEELSDIDKFDYLKSLLEHTAKDAISGLTLTTISATANYQEAVEILKRRFGSKQQIISKHMDILLNLDPVVSTSVKALRHLHDHVESHVRGLKALGVNSKTYGSLLLPVLLSELPADIRLIASREISEDEWSLDALLKIMERETVARERVGTNHQRTMERTPPKAVALMNEFSTNVPTCCYCQQPHSSNNCKSVTNVGERKEILKRAGRCYTCLRKGHVSHSCRSTAKCQKCKGRHHSSICTMKPSENSTPKDPVSLGTTAHQKPVQLEVPTASTTKPGLNPGAPTFPAIGLLTEANETVLLQTALTNIYNLNNPQALLQVRLILDSGSQRSYMASRVKETLCLEPEDECQLAIAAFGNRRSASQPCEVVRVGVKVNSGPDLELTLFTVPYICEPLSIQPISLCTERYKHLSHQI